MLAYKAFGIGLVCRGFQFVEGLNKTDQANCRANGFHCAENPLDCLVHYRNIEKSVYYLVEASGDIDEDEYDSKISCTELTLIRKLSLKDLLLEGLLYMQKRPLREWSSIVKQDSGNAGANGYVVVRGASPVAYGEIGSLLALSKEDADTKRIVEIGLIEVDGATNQSQTYYKVDGSLREGCLHED